MSLEDISNGKTKECDMKALNVMKYIDVLNKTTTYSMKVKSIDVLISENETHHMFFRIKDFSLNYLYAPITNYDKKYNNYPYFSCYLDKPLSSHEKPKYFSEYEREYMYNLAKKYFRFYCGL